MGTEEWKVLLPLRSVKVQNYWCQSALEGPLGRVASLAKAALSRYGSLRFVK
jgi:hypothetical protein